MEAQRPRDKEHGDPEREHGDLGRKDRETRGEEVNTRDWEGRVTLTHSWTRGDRRE